MKRYRTESDFHLYIILYSIFLVVVSSRKESFKNGFDKDDNAAPTIKFASYISPRYNCLNQIQEQIVSTFKDLLDGDYKIGYADPAFNHNLGEQLAWAGSIKMFERFGKHPIIHCGVSNEVESYQTCSSQESFLIKHLANNSGFLYYNPGGNWGNLYRNIHEQRNDLWKFAVEHNIRFVSGPQSIYYDSKSKLIEKDDEFVKTYGRKSDVLYFRQHDSFEFAAKHYGAYTSVRESPDASFMLGLQMSHKKPKYDVFMLVREDIETGMRGKDGYLMHDKICKSIKKAGYTCAIGDWGDGSTVPRRKVPEITAEYAHIGVQIAIETISLGQMIITDRLHGAILAFLLGKPLFFIDNSYGKISNTLFAALGNKKACSDVEGLGIYSVSFDVDIIITEVLNMLKANSKSILDESV